MAVTVVLSEIQRDTLAKVCDTFAPSIEAADDPTGFFARSASDLHIAEAIEQTLATAVPEDQVAGFRALLGALSEQGFNEAGQEGREQALHATADSGPDALAGISALRGLTLMLFYALPDAATGRNPNWEAIGYPGPASAPPSAEDAPKRIAVTRPPDEGLTLTADVVVVGSGAGGGVVAGELATKGKDVVVLEMGGYYNEADFNQLELWAYEHLYRGGGVTQTANGSIALMAGSNLGGGTTVNWTNMLPATPRVRAQWESEHGLEGLAGPEFDAHIAAIFERCSVNDRCSDYNGPNQRMEDACAKLGYSHQRITRNADPAAYRAETAGYLGFGDQSGSKQGTMKTYLQDAAEAGGVTVSARSRVAMLTGPVSNRPKCWATKRMGSACRSCCRHRSVTSKSNVLLTDRSVRLCGNSTALLSSHCRSAASPVRSSTSKVGGSSAVLRPRCSASASVSSSTVEVLMVMPLKMSCAARMPTR
jgi:hypothetical protein